MDQSKTTRAIVPVTNFNGDIAPGYLCAVTVPHHPAAPVASIAKAAIALVATGYRANPQGVNDEDWNLVMLETRPTPQFQALWELIETPRRPEHIELAIHIDESGAVYAVRAKNMPPELSFTWTVTSALPKDATEPVT